jgi:hypothetical protein
MVRPKGVFSGAFGFEKLLEAASAEKAERFAKEYLGDFTDAEGMSLTEHLPDPDPGETGWDTAPVEFKTLAWIAWCRYFVELEEYQIQVLGIRARPDGRPAKAIHGSQRAKITEFTMALREELIAPLQPMMSGDAMNECFVEVCGVYEDEPEKVRKTARSADRYIVGMDPAKGESRSEWVEMFAEAAMKFGIGREAAMEMSPDEVIKLVETHKRIEGLL